MPANSFGELIAQVRAEPGKLNWAAVTGAHEFIFAGWLKRAGLSMNEVPYRNPVDAANDLAENRVQVYSSALAIVRPQFESRQNQNAGDRQCRSRAKRAGCSDHGGSGFSGTHARRACRFVRAARHAA